MLLEVTIAADLASAKRRASAWIVGTGVPQSAEARSGVVFSAAPFAFCVIGVFLGITVGAIPGLTGAMLIALTLPLTFYMDPTNAINRR